jgi:hypothetical protein
MFEGWMSEWGMSVVYDNSVRARYTTVQPFYHQNQHDGDGCLIPPQDPCSGEVVLRCEIKQKEEALDNQNRLAVWFANQHYARK